ncbi:MAG TPA: hypothetical protein VII30_06285 [Gemmatimonadaceae bacterium]
MPFASVLLALSQIAGLQQASASGRTAAEIFATVLGAAAWPIVVLIGLFLYRDALSTFLQGVSARITKLSVFKVEVELAVATDRRYEFVLNELRNTSQQAIIYDSASALLESVKDTTPADYSIIDLGEGGEWITTRLFLAAVLLERMRGVRCFVFVQTQGSIRRRFAALAHPALVRWRLAALYPWLEAAYSNACVIAYSLNQQPPHPAEIATTQMNFASEHGAVDPETAASLAKTFLASLQKMLDDKNPDVPSEWTTFAHYRERATWVTPSTIGDWLPRECFHRYMDQMLDIPRDRRARAILRRPGEFLALVDANSVFMELVNRGAVLEDVAQQMSVE